MFCSSGSPQLSKLERRHHHKLLRYLKSLTNLWMIVAEAIYDVGESRIFYTYFSSKVTVHHNVFNL